ncbi:MAG: hypothetical protein ACM31C_02970 [Acidobacteriota bacterium]
MGSRFVLGALLLCACNAHLGDTPSDASGKPPDAQLGSDARPADAAIDALPAWGPPVGVPGASDSTLNIDDDTLNSRQTELYFGEVDATLGVKQLWLMTRATPADAWGAPAKLDATFNVGGTTPPAEESPRLAPDDKTIYFGRGGDIYYATRTAVGQAWSTPQPLAEVNTADYEKWLAVCDNGYYMVSRGTAANGQDLFEGQLGGGAAVPATELNSTANEISTFLTSDCKTTYFASNRSGTTTYVYTATRADTSSAWTSPAQVTDFGTTELEDPWLSPDGLVFYFASQRYGGTNTNKGIYCSAR